MDQRNLLLAVVLSVAILIGYQMFMIATAPPPSVPAEGSEVAATGELAPSVAKSPAPELGGEALGGLDREAALAKTERLPIRSDTLSGSIDLTGGRIDDLLLTRYRETLEADSPNIVLLSPPGAPEAYFASFGWSSADSSLALPTAETRWQSADTRLVPGMRALLTWDNGAGLKFEREIALDGTYAFTVTQRVTNEGTQAVSLAPYGLISRSGTPDVLSFYILHEGLIGVLGGTLEEIDYDDLPDKREVSRESTGGWIGITDKYWLVALLPDQQETVIARFVYNDKGPVEKYQTDILYNALTIAPGASVERTSLLFAGAKEIDAIDGYEEKYGVTDFWKAIDFGWFFFITRPFMTALHWLSNLVGNFGVGILLFTVCVKAVFFPLANKSYVSMAKMRKLQPQMLELRERFSEDKQRLNQEMMALYKREGANPLSGCLPILVQIPVFFSLYKVIFIDITLRHAPFYGWIHDLSAADPTSILNGFGLLPWGVPELGALNLFNIGVWPLLMGITMFMQQRLNPQPPDPIQAKIFTWMPIMFTFLLAQFAAGLVIYWTWNNILSILQQATIMKRAVVPVTFRLPGLPGRRGGGSQQQPGGGSGGKRGGGKGA